MFTMKDLAVKAHSIYFLCGVQPSFQETKIDAVPNYIWIQVLRYSNIVKKARKFSDIKPMGGYLAFVNGKYCYRTFSLGLLTHAPRKFMDHIGSSRSRYDYD